MLEAAGAEASSQDRAIHQAQGVANARPLAVYTENDDTDISSGQRLLEEAGFDVRVLNSRDPQTIVDGARGAMALVVSYAEISEAVISELPDLKIIALMSMGADNVDLETAQARGIWVTNVLGVATEEVATHTLALILHLVRGIGFYDRAVQEGRWNDRSEFPQLRASRLTLGIVGLGRIGLKVAALARPLFGRVVGYDPFVPETDEDRARLAAAGVERVELEELNGTANVVSLHVPLTAATEALVDLEFLRAIPARSYIVNVSRGALIDSGALREALDSGHIAGAGLDVLDIEPAPAGHPLVGHPKVVVTPHVAYFSDMADAEYVRIQAQNVVSWWQTGSPISAVAGPGDASQGRT